MQTTTSEIEDKILKAATTVFFREGYDKTNMSIIAEEAGISRPSLYYYYRTKDKIFSAIFSDMINSLLPQIESVISTDEPVKVRIQKFVHLYLVNYLDKPDMVRFIFNETHRDCDHFIKTIYELQVPDELNRVIELIHNEVKEGHIKEVPLYAYMFTFIGLISVPFFTKPLASKVFLKSGSDDFWRVADTYDELVNLWEPYAVDQLCHLLLP